MNGYDAWKTTDRDRERAESEAEAREIERAFPAHEDDCVDVAAHLTPTESAMLALMARHGSDLTTMQDFTKLMGWRVVENTGRAIIHTHLTRLRTKLADYEIEIETVRPATEADGVPGRSGALGWRLRR